MSIGGGLMQLVAYGAQDVYLQNVGNIFTNPNAYANHEYYHAICKPKTRNHNIISHKNKQTGIPRQLKRGTTCIISYDEIGENDTYTICHVCKQIYGWGSIIIWMQTSKTCPHCRCDMDINHMNKYVNTSNKKGKHKNNK